MTTIKILLAEDHIITRQGIRRLLEDEANIQIVGEVGDGEEAVKAVAEKKPDLVIMDIAMPKLNGIEATKQIKAIHPTTPVLILTAYDDDEYIFSLLKAGAAGYLLKTVSGDDLVSAIRSVFKGEPVLDPVVTRKVINHVRSQAKTREPAKDREHLSEREMAVLKLAAAGQGNKAIAKQLNISRRSVEGIFRTMFNKLGVGSRVEAIMYGLKMGWFKLEELY